MTKKGTGKEWKVERICKHCRDTFMPILRNNVFCSPACCHAFWVLYRKEQRQEHGMPVGTYDNKCSVGAFGELVVAADLLAKGFAVYRSVSSTARFDLVAFGKETLFSVEVTTAGFLKRDGTISSQKKKGVADVIAFVLSPNKTIVYEPDPDVAIEAILRRSDKRKNVVQLSASGGFRSVK